MIIYTSIKRKQNKEKWKSIGWLGFVNECNTEKSSDFRLVSTVYERTGKKNVIRKYKTMNLLFNAIYSFLLVMLCLFVLVGCLIALSPPMIAFIRIVAYELDRSFSILWECVLKITCSRNENKIRKSRR